MEILQQLADVAQHCNGLFYDEPKPTSSSKRRKYAFSVDPADLGRNKNPELKSKPETFKAFESFDFDHQTYNFARDSDELKKTETQLSSLSKKSHFVILSHNIRDTVSWLQNALSQNVQFQEMSSRVMSMFVHRYLSPQSNTYYIDCYWIVDSSQVHHYGTLVDVYIQKSQHLLDLTLCQVADQAMEETNLKLRQQVKNLVDSIHTKRRQSEKNEA